MNRALFVIISALCFCLPSAAQSTAERDSVIARINRIKLDPGFVFAEATMPDSTDAYNRALEALETREGAQLLSHKRGNQTRVFLYAKRKTEVESSPDDFIHVSRLESIKTYNEFANLLFDGSIEFGNVDADTDLDMIDGSYIVVLSGRSLQQVLSPVTPKKTRLDYLKNTETKSINYKKGNKVIWIRSKEQ